MAEEIILTPEERLAKLSDILLSNVIKGDDESKYKRQLLFSQFTPSIFRDEYHIIYKVLYNFRERMLTPDEEFYNMYLVRNENVVLDSSRYIDINAFASNDENKVVAYAQAVLKVYTRLLTLEPVSLDTFELTVEKYKEEFKCLKIGEALSRSKEILYDGIDEGRNHLQGYDQSVAYIKSKAAEVDSLLSSTVGKGFIDSRDAGLVDDDSVQPEKIGDFGLISELNEHLGGIFTSKFYSVMAPTKGGKSKFCARLCHNILENGNNVVVWAHEGGYYAWMCQMRAIHYDWFYNRDKIDRTQFKVGISQDVIMRNQWRNEQQKALENTSRTDLFQREDFGYMTFVDRPFKVETFIDEIETAVAKSNAKAVIIDYLQLIGWDSNRYSKTTAVGTAYQKLLDYARKRNVAVISPAQFTQDFTKELSKSSGSSNVETRTGGGESAEVVRTPDVNIALYASIDDLMKNHMQILSIPSRDCQPFPPIDIYCDLAVCMFASIKQNEDTSASSS